jgi:hypothetical protein
MPATPTPDRTRGYRSKSAATWLALIAGPLGLHRFYLHGLRDPWGWMYLPPTLLGLAGVQRMRAFGQDDRIAWVLIPLLGLAISAAMLSAIVLGLTADERWDARYNPGRSGRRTGWLPVLGVIAALLLGATVLMGTIAFAGQRFFEWRLQPPDGGAAQNSEPPRS